MTLTLKPTTEDAMAELARVISGGKPTAATLTAAVRLSEESYAWRLGEIIEEILRAIAEIAQAKAQLFNRAIRISPPHPAFRLQEDDDYPIAQDVQERLNLQLAPLGFSIKVEDDVFYPSEQDLDLFDRGKFLFITFTLSRAEADSAEGAESPADVTSPGGA